MLQNQATDIADATTNVPSDAPDAKTRRYDRQLRLWAATGQAALESARILVVGASATNTATLKNLVLPGIGHFTLLDPAPVSGADAGNNFFLEGARSIGKPRAEEAVRLLRELNDGVDGIADLRSLADVLGSKEGRTWIRSFSLVIAHNAPPAELDQLSALLWEDDGPPLAAIRSAGFIAEFFVQYRKHEVIETHSDERGSLRIDRPWPELAAWADGLDFSKMDTTDHSHIPYVVLLVRALADWKKAHGGQPPKTTKEKDAFKSQVFEMRVKPDEENVDEAHRAAFRAYPFAQIPFEIQALLDSPHIDTLTVDAPVFDRLLGALKAFVGAHGALPLNAALPDMHADTANYVRLQTLYKARANTEKAQFRALVQGDVDDALVDAFVKNAHALRVLHGRRFGELDADKDAIANAVGGATYTREPITHFALSAFAAIGSAKPTLPELRAAFDTLVGPAGADLPEKEVADCLGEIVRAPTAELPNVAAFLGGLVAQEAIKVITKQYVPIDGYCIVDLISTFTGIVR